MEETIKARWRKVAAYTRKRDLKGRREGRKEIPFAVGQYWGEKKGFLSGSRSGQKGGKGNAFGIGARKKERICERFPVRGEKKETMGDALL